MVRLEAKGVPSVVICTDEFLGLARLRVEAVGLPPRRIVAIPHPLASLDPATITARARDVLSAVVEALA